MDSEYSILLAVPDGKLRGEIRNSLNENGFKVASAATGREVEQHFLRLPFAIAVLDIRLPDTSGIALCSSIRATSQTPVILITAQGDDQEILAGLEAGASDFIMQPVRPYELVARVRTVLKRTSSPLALPGWIIQCGDLLLDLRSRSLVKRGSQILLTRTELRLLSFFMRHPGVTVSKKDLLVHVWGFHDVSGDMNLIDTAIKRLRQTIEDIPKEPRYIQTVWGQGYRFVPPA